MITIRPVPVNGFVECWRGILVAGAAFLLQSTCLAQSAVVDSAVVRSAGQDPVAAQAVGQPLPQPSAQEDQQPSMRRGFQRPRVEPLADFDFRPASPTTFIPPNHAAELFDRPPEIRSMGTDRPWEPTLFFWDAPALAYRPLYFEDVNLERHGLSFGCLQPAVSAGHAFGRLVALPYMMTKRPPCRPEYTLGHVRPGNPVPYRVHRLPDDPRAAAVEVGAIAGGILLIP